MRAPSFGGTGTGPAASRCHSASVSWKKPKKLVQLRGAVSTVGAPSSLQVSRPGSRLGQGNPAGVGGRAGGSLHSSADGELSLGRICVLCWVCLGLLCLLKLLLPSR